MTDWNVLKQDYITSKIGYRKLAEKYNVDKGQVQRRGTSEGWPEERKRYRAVGTQDTGTAFSKRFPKDADVESRINLLVDLGLEKLRKGIEMVQPTDTSALRQLLSSLKDIKEIAGAKLGLEREEWDIRRKLLEAQNNAGREEGETGIVIIPMIK